MKQSVGRDRCSEAAGGLPDRIGASGGIGDFQDLEPGVAQGTGVAARARCEVDDARFPGTENSDEFDGERVGRTNGGWLRRGRRHRSG
jgi:hypothetical protein